MTPKDKANELFDKVNELIPIEADFNDSAEKASLKIMKDHFASVKISLLIVDEVIEALGYEGTIYWQKVRHELEKR